MVYINWVHLKTLLEITGKLPLHKRSKSDQPLYEIELLFYLNEDMEAAVKQCDGFWFDIALMRNKSFWRTQWYSYWKLDRCMTYIIWWTGLPQTTSSDQTTYRPTYKLQEAPPVHVKCLYPPLYLTSSTLNTTTQSTREDCNNDLENLPQFNGSVLKVVLSWMRLEIWVGSHFTLWQQKMAISDDSQPYNSAKG